VTLGLTQAMRVVAGAATPSHPAGHEMPAPPRELTGACPAWVNSHNPRDPQTSSGGVGREDGPGGIDFHTRSRTMPLAADDRPVPRFGA
jgi:hypothetical protein